MILQKFYHIDSYEKLQFWYKLIFYGRIWHNNASLRALLLSLWFQFQCPIHRNSDFRVEKLQFSFSIQNQFFMTKFHIICWRVFVGVFLCAFETEFAITTLLALKSYNFDQNRIFMSEFNVTSEYQIENISLNERIKAEFAETAIFVPKSYITYRNQFLVAEFVVTERVCLG